MPNLFICRWYNRNVIGIIIITSTAEEYLASSVLFNGLVNNNIQYFPNPTNGILNIKINGELANEEKTITVIAGKQQ